MSKQLFEQFLSQSEAIHRPGTTRKFKRVLPDFLRYAALPFNTAMLESFRTRRLKSGISRRSVNVEMALLQSFINYCIRHGQQMNIDFPRALAVPQKQYPAIEATHLQKLLFACFDKREELLIRLLYQSGVRRMELQTLEWADFDLAGHSVNIVPKPQFGHVPKGWKTRTLPLPKDLCSWLGSVKGSGLLFPTSGNRPDTRLCEKAKEIAKRAGVPLVGLHHLRHHYANQVNRSGADVRTVQFLLGHSAITTTMLYLKPSPQVAMLVDEAFSLKAIT